VSVREGRIGFRRLPGPPAQLSAACPNGIDLYFENVGGAAFDAVLPLLNTRARVPVCGLIEMRGKPRPFGAGKDSADTAGVAYAG